MAEKFRWKSEHLLATLARRNNWVTHRKPVAYRFMVGDNSEVGIT